MEEIPQEAPLGSWCEGLAAEDSHDGFIRRIPLHAVGVAESPILLGMHGGSTVVTGCFLGERINVANNLSGL